MLLALESMNRIAAAIDFSPQSRLALAAADELALRFGSTLQLVHVHAVVDVAVYDFAVIEQPAELARETERAEATLRDWAHELKTPPSRVEIAVIAGPPLGELLRLSEHVDLMVVGTHGRKGISHFLLGSVAERVARGARCSVLIVKASGEDGEGAR